MTSIQYLRSIINGYLTTPLLLLPITPAYQAVTPILRAWGNNFIDDIKISGSNAKGTAIAGVADLDLFISLHSHTLNSYTLAQLFISLENYLLKSMYIPRTQNVSIRINYLGTEVDIVPAVKFAGNSNDHWLHVRKSGQDRIKTNINTHINRVVQSGRIEEIKLTKIWRKLNNLDFPSIYLEETVISCLNGHQVGAIDNNFWKVLEYLSNSFPNARIIDPSNGANIISNDLNQSEKNLIKSAAKFSRTQKYWKYIVW